DYMRCYFCEMPEDEHRARYGRSLHVHRLLPGSEYTVEGCLTVCSGCHGFQPRRAVGSIDLAHPAGRRTDDRHAPWFTVRLPEWCRGRLRRRQKETRLPVTTLVRRAVEEMLNKGD